CCKNGQAHCLSHKKTFGESDVNDLYVTESQTDDQKTVFTTNAWPKLPFTVQLPGRYNVNNALAALAVGDALAIPAPAMQQGLEAAIFTKKSYRMAAWGSRRKKSSVMFITLTQPLFERYYKPLRLANHRGNGLWC
ncbi:Mur ligase family protein, partial [Fructilactobacillus florum]|uniref:Mur ligase family protein n=1 Tax=Fructilactobacillus florum TaxID=640331 RepID=UPI002091F4E4